MFLRKSLSVTALFQDRREYEARMSSPDGGDNSFRSNNPEACPLRLKTSKETPWLGRL